MSSISRRFKSISCVLSLLLVVLIPEAATMGGTRISNPAAVDGPVKEYQVASTGQFAVYSTLDSSDVPHLFSVRLAGGSPVSLTAPLPAEYSSYYLKYQISPNGSRVVYLAHQESPTVNGLYSIPIAGGTPVRLSKTGSNVFYFAVSPDSLWIIFISYDATTKYHFFRASLTGGTGSAVEFTPSGAHPQMVDAISISPDSQHIIYKGDMQPLDGWGIYSFPITGNGSQYVRLSMPVTTQWILDSLVTPDGQSLIYRYPDESMNPVMNRLYSVPIDGPATSYYDLSGTLIPGGGVYNYFQISPDGRYVVFAAEKEVVDKVELYSYFLATRYPIITFAVKISVAIPNDRDVNFGTFKISPDSKRVVYNAYQNNIHDLFSVPINGPILNNVKINQPISPSTPFGWNDAMTFSPDSSHIVYTSMQDTQDVIDLYSVPATGPASSAIKLNPAQVKNSGGYAMVQIPVFSPDGLWVFYTANIVLNRVDLLQSPALGPSSKSVNLSAVGATGNAVAWFTQVPGHSMVVYTGPVSSPSYELFRVNSQAAVFVPVVKK